MSLRILIADDEPLARQRLRAMVEELGHEVCAEAGDGAEAELALHRTQPDAALLDIEMPPPDGLTLAQRMETEYPETSVVLVTAHGEHGLAAFDAAVRDYVLKPVRRERLALALDRAAERRKAGIPARTQIHLTIGRKGYIVHLDELSCFTAEQGYVIGRSAKLEGFVDARLHELEERFASALLRVHRSCLAVKTAIAGIETRSASDHRLLFRDGMKPVPVSRRQVPCVRQFLSDQASRPAP